jgi:outer membrane protein TolC
MIVPAEYSSPLSPLPSAPGPVACDARSHFFHAPRDAAVADEVALARWWRRFGDRELDRLVDATNEQGFEVCIASLHLQQACEHEGDDEFLPLCDYYAVRIRQIAATVRHYFGALCLQERIACIDAAIDSEAMAARRAHSTSEADAAAMHDADARPALLAELHAHRIRLRMHWDVTVVALARQTAQPVEMLTGRLQGRLLPAACAEMPAIGGPEHLRRRRPDLLAFAHRVASGGTNVGPNSGNSCSYSQRLMRLESEQRCDLAEKEIELTLATLAGTQAELIPVRASVASAEARCQRLRRSAPAGGVDPRAIADADCALQAIRDREIETRGRTYLALVEVFLAAGCGWPILSDPEFTA